MLFKKILNHFFYGKNFSTTNFSQYKEFLSDQQKKLIIVYGPAGTGKTMMACEEAIIGLKQKIIKRIVITRPVVTADEDIGFLPGKLEDKMAPWTRPIFDVFFEHYTRKAVTSMINEGIIEIAPLAYMRGRTFKNAFIIGDEMQNATENQMKMLLTRIGENSRLVATGDLDQNDLKTGKISGLKDFIGRMEKEQDSMIGVVRLKKEDIKRSEIVWKVVNIYEKNDTN